jgi:hypothetical protein
MPLRDLCPPILWNYVRQRRYGEEVRFANRRYHVMQTDYSATPLHVGRYAEIFERVSRNDPHFSPELRRYRTYNILPSGALVPRSARRFPLGRRIFRHNPAHRI